MAEAAPRLSLIRIYASSAPDTLRFTGPACFGGSDGIEFVLVPVRNIAHGTWWLSRRPFGAQPVSRPAARRTTLGFVLVDGVGLVTR